MRLVICFGSWTRVQVAFYDFIFGSALEMCPHHSNQAMMQGFLEGSDPYEDAVQAINKKFKTFEDAWSAFLEHIMQDFESFDPHSEGSAREAYMEGFESRDSLLP